MNENSHPATNVTPAPVAPTETPAERFVRIGDKRLANALREIGKLPALNGPTYESTEKQRQHIVKKLKDEVKKVEQAYTRAPGNSTKPTTSLADI